MMKASKLTFCFVLLTTVVLLSEFLYLNINYHSGYLHQCVCKEHGLVNNQRTIGESNGQEIILKNIDVEEKRDCVVDNSSSNDEEDHDVQQLSKKGYTITPDRTDNASRNQGDVNVRNKLKSLIHLSDYLKYPCLPGSNQSERLRSLDRCIRTVNVHLVADTVKSGECVKLNVGTPICIHDPTVDIPISGSIHRTGAWENKLVEKFLETLNKVRDITVLDIGCNIGVYTLMAAREGKRVVSIDANVDNLRLLAKSLILGKLTENVTLIWNALSDTYTNVSLVTNQFNVGAFYVNTDKKSISGNDVIIDTILLDDLMYLFEGKPVGIKMDVESFELYVLKGGMTFMKNMDVRFIQMEIGHHRKIQSGQSIVITLSYFGFKPFANCLRYKNLVNLPLTDWPFNVCFIKI